MSINLYTCIYMYLCGNFVIQICSTFTYDIVYWGDCIHSQPFQLVTCSVNLICSKRGQSTPVPIEYLEHVLTISITVTNSWADNSPSVPHRYSLPLCTIFPLIC